VLIKSRIKVSPGSAPVVRREMLRRLKIRFDREGIETPYPQMKLVTPTRQGPGAEASEPDVV
jgi:small-conductance mechanosensitive channel